MGKTVIEKIISSHSKKSVYAGEMTIIDVDATMATDATAPIAMKSFKEMGGEQVVNPESITLVIDHASPAPNERIANLHQSMRDFAKKQSIRLYDVGEGICHQLMVDNHHVQPGEVVLGADSHTVTYGALGAFATGVGSTDLAGVWLTGQTWIKVPETIKIEINGQLPEDVSSKDIILHIVGKLGISGATYKAIEFTGTTVHSMSLSSRMTLANMSIEMGAKAGIVDTENLEWSEPFERVIADDDAIYDSIHKIDASILQPQVSVPHSPDHVVNIKDLIGTTIHQGFIGSCTNGKLEDLQTAARVLEGKKIKKGTRLLIAPASRKVFHDAMADGTAQILMNSGATFLTSGCGPCVGTHMGVPGNGENVISSTNRNFPGRMGNPKANVYLSSPSVVAQTMIHGEITYDKKGSL
ncbi:3-isopropylmalate dehydratase (plasmid) [Bacillaceae bacterium JMAK1]|nr:3-isopropylmalate dehydratase [Bacillaceae bacterium JMAK1]